MTKGNLLQIVGLRAYRIAVVGLLALVAFRHTVTVEGTVHVGSVRGTVDVSGKQMYVAARPKRKLRPRKNPLLKKRKKHHQQSQNVTGLK